MKHVNQNFLRDENGNLQVVTKDGRVRKHWKTKFRNQAKRFLKSCCEKCGQKENLTIHHVPPISKSLDTKKFVTLCRKCHDLEEELND